MKYLLLLFAILRFTLGVFAQESTSLLWEIKGKKVKSPSYIFGTMHLIPQDDFFFPDTLTYMVSTADRLIMEIGGIQEQLSALHLLRLESGSILDYFTEEQEDSIFNYLETEMQLDKKRVLAQYGKMKPLVLLQVLTQNAFGENPASYELQLESIAQKHHVALEGLETIEQQIGFFDRLSNEDQAKLVMSSLYMDSTSANETEKLIATYLSQDVDEMANLISNSDMGIDSFEEDFLKNRNLNWIPKIKNHIKKNSCFIAVGAGHLGGPNGLIELLRKEGYTVEPVILKSTHP